jgi:hypothetical protein
VFSFETTDLYRQYMNIKHSLACIIAKNGLKTLRTPCRCIPPTSCYSGKRESNFMIYWCRSGYVNCMAKAKNQSQCQYGTFFP